MSFNAHTENSRKNLSALHRCVQLHLQCNMILILFHHNRIITHASCVPFCRNYDIRFAIFIYWARIDFVLTHIFASYGVWYTDLVYFFRKFFRYESDSKYIFNGAFQHRSYLVEPIGAITKHKLVCILYMCGENKWRVIAFSFVLRERSKIVEYVRA